MKTVLRLMRHLIESSRKWRIKPFPEHTPSSRLAFSRSFFSFLLRRELPRDTPLTHFFHRRHFHPPTRCVSFPGMKRFLPSHEASSFCIVQCPGRKFSLTSRGQKRGLRLLFIRVAARPRPFLRVTLIPSTGSCCSPFPPLPFV